MKYKCCMRIMAAVILVSFLNCPMFGEVLTGMLNDSGNGGMRFYSDSEVREIVGELSAAAEEAIEGAAAEAAKAAAMASLEREGAARREAAAAVAEARHWQEEYRTAQGRGMKNAVITGVACFLGGLVVGVFGTIEMRN